MAAVLIAVLAILILLLLLVQDAKGNFIYWSSASPNSSIGRAKINGTGLNNAFITGLSSPTAVAVDSKFIYWTDNGTDRIGRANLDGSGANPNFIAAGVTDPNGIAVTQSNGIFWLNNGPPDTIGHANIDGANPVANFITTAAGESSCGLAADSNFLYWYNGSGNFARAPLNGSGAGQDFVSGANFFCGPAVDSNFLYWPTDGGNAVARAPVAGGSADNSFVPAGTTSGGPSGVAVNSQYIFWGDYAADTIGRANINGSSPNHDLVTGAAITGNIDASQFAAAPSNKVTVNSITKKKKKGTATINAKVPGPGQVTLANTGTEDVNAVAASVKQLGLTITQASSFKLAVKPVGKTAKKLKKQLKKKRKAKVKVKAFVTFVPAGVAGVPNSQPVKTTLIKQRKK